MVATSYDTGRTKTEVTRRVPVHPTLAKIQAAWKLSHWERIHGRAPSADDLVVPTRTMTTVDASDAVHAFKLDLNALGLRVDAGEHRDRGGHDLRAWFITTCQEHGAHRDHEVRRDIGLHARDVASALRRGREAQGRGPCYRFCYSGAKCREALAKVGDPNGIRTSPRASRTANHFRGFARSRDVGSVGAPFSSPLVIARLDLLGNRCPRASTRSTPNFQIGSSVLSYGRGYLTSMAIIRCPKNHPVEVASEPDQFRNGVILRWTGDLIQICDKCGWFEMRDGVPTWPPYPMNHTQDNVVHLVASVALRILRQRFNERERETLAEGGRLAALVEEMEPELRRQLPDVDWDALDYTKVIREVEDELEHHST